MAIFISLTSEACTFSIILVDSIEDYDQKQSERRCDIVKENFSEAVVKSFQPFSALRKGRLRHADIVNSAQEILHSLQLDNGGQLAKTGHSSWPPIVFVAHNLGIVVVKQLLLLAQRSRSHQWIPIRTVGLYFVELPGQVTESQPFENSDIHPFYLSEVPCDIRGSLQNIEAQFTMVSAVFQIHTYTTLDSYSQLYLSSGYLPWKSTNDAISHGQINTRLSSGNSQDFHHDDRGKLDNILSDVRVCFEKGSPKLDLEYTRLCGVFSWPDASLIGLSRSYLGSSIMIDWLRGNSTYVRWMTGTQPSVMNLTGNNGQGMIYLSSALIDWVEKTKTEGEEQAIILTFAFNHWQSGRNSSYSFVTSLIRQALALFPELCQHPVFLSVNDMFLSLSRLWIILRFQIQEISKSRKVVLVIHAIDQCLEPIVDKIVRLSTIGTQSSSGPKNIKIFITSREPLDIPPSISRYILSLGDSSWRGVVRNIVDQRVAWIVNQRPVWKGFESDIVEKLCHGEHTLIEMMLHLDMLEKDQIASTKDALTCHLFSPSLSSQGVFNMMMNFEIQPDIDVATPAHLALNWLFYSARPLSLPELSVALALCTTGRENLSWESLIRSVSWDIMRDIGSQLGSAVKVIDNHITLSHPIIHEFLLGHPKQLLIPKFHGIATDLCLRYIDLWTNHQSVEDPSHHQLLEKREIREAASLLDYAIVYWVHHFNLQESPVEPGLDQRVMDFLNSSTGNKWALTFQDTSNVENEDLALSLAAQLGPKHMLQQYRARYPDHLDTALRIAALANNQPELVDLFKVCTTNNPVMGDPELERILGVLVKYGDVECIAKLFESMEMSKQEPQKQELATVSDDHPLLLAASHGNAAAVACLLEYGFPLNIVGQAGDSPVHLAARLGDVDTLSTMERLSHHEFTELLSSTNLDGMTPLQLTCIAGVLDAFAMVIHHSPQLVNQADKESLPPLELAAKYGQIDIVRKLLSLDVARLPEGAISKALEKAANNGHLTVVTALFEALKTTASVTSQEEDTEKETTETADALKEVVHESLLLAIRHNHLETINYLMSESQRLPEQLSSYLIEAGYWGHLEVLNLLSSMGVSPNLVDGEYNPLMDQAIMDNRVDIVNFLMQQGIGPQWDHFENSIHFAARKGRLICLRRLLFEGSKEEVSRRDDDDNTPLEAAAKACTPSSVQELLEWYSRNGILQEAVEMCPRAISLAIDNTYTHDQLEVLRLLLDNHWPTNEIDGSPFLHIAVKNQAIEVIKLFLDRNVDINCQNKTNKTALRVAVEEDAVEVAQFLLSRGADPNIGTKTGRTPLHVCIESCQEEMTSLLLGTGEKIEGQILANLESKTVDGWRPIHYAAQSPAMTGILLTARNTSTQPGEQRIDPNALTNDHLTPLLIAMENKNEEGVRLLIRDAQADPNIYGGLMHSILQDAAFQGLNELCEFLLNSNVDPNAQGGALGSPFHAAVYSKSLELVSLFLSRNANPGISAPPFGTPLQMLFWMPHDYTGEEGQKIREIVETLIRHGADINAFGPAERSPLHLTLPLYRAGTTIPLDLLLESGATANVVDHNGITPLHSAVSGGYCWLPEDVSQKLFKAGASAVARDKCDRSVLYHAAMTSDQGIFNSILNSLPEDKRKAELAAALPAVLKQPRAPIENDLSDCSQIFRSVLQEVGADLNVPDHNGWTVLDVAESFKLGEHMRELQTRGAQKGNVDAKKPESWSLVDKHHSVSILEDGMVAEVRGKFLPEMNREFNSAVLANCCIPNSEDLFYFEVDILECQDNSAIAVGVLQEPHSLNELVGWQCGAWGYHSDDGSILSDNGVVGGSGFLYGAGATIGVAFDPRQSKLWFTLNGTKVGEFSVSAFAMRVFEHFLKITGSDVYDIVGQLYPAVSFQSGKTWSLARVKANFGPDFKFNPQGKEQDEFEGEENW
ncbi:unnamed protein product [Penicillium glandicola]